MKANIGKIKVKFKGQSIEIDLDKELSINENLMNSQLRSFPASYYILCSLRDTYIRKRDTLEREKEEAYSKAWLHFKEANERWTNEFVSHKVKLNKAYQGALDRYEKAAAKAQEFITICRVMESRENILRTMNANLRKGV